jgi:hypothetical protein
MTKLLPCALAAVAVALAGCQTPPPAGGPAQPGPLVTTTHPYYAGNGTVQNIYPAPTSAAAGSSGQSMQRLEIRMDNGLVQYVDTPSGEFAKGMRVTLTEDHIIRRM